LAAPAIPLEDLLVQPAGAVQTTIARVVVIALSAESAVRLSLTLQRTATCRYQVVGGEFENPPYATLSIRFAQRLTYLGAFRAQPEKPVWLTL
jgi:hypothetical protein